MDRMLFISKLVEYLAWPLTLIIGLLIFKEPISLVVNSLKKFRYKDIEMEFEELIIDNDQNINEIASYLSRSAHSFQWFRDNTDICRSNNEFDSIISNHSHIFKKVTIIDKDKNGKRVYPGLPGIKLTAEARKDIL